MDSSLINNQGFFCYDKGESDAKWVKKMIPTVVPYLVPIDYSMLYPRREMQLRAVEGIEHLWATQKTSPWRELPVRDLQSNPDSSSSTVKKERQFPFSHLGQYVDVYV